MSHLRCLATRIAALLILLLMAPGRAGADDGSQVVVLYNSRLPESRAVADHYAAVRKVPPGQIFGFALTTNEVMTRADFKDFLQTRLAADLVEAGLWKFGDMTIPASTNEPQHTEKRVIRSKIRYAVLCWGIPLKIARDDSLQDYGPLPPNPNLRGNEAAVDSELSWLPLSEEKIRLAGPLGNPFFGCTNRALLTPTNGLLLVARLDGPTPEIANQLVDKAVAAESNGLWGRAYFDSRGLQPDNSFYPGDQWILAGAEICRLNGFDVETDTNSDTFPAWFPLSQIAIYAGWYDWNASGPFEQPKVEFMPGAFAYHIQSFSANTLRSTTDNWCGPLLAKGATCTMGCVYEPYLQFTPNIALFLEFFCGGWTFGEAAWAAQPALSWQTTVVGDPLYQPFKKAPSVLYTQLAKDKNPLIEWSWNRIVNLELVRGVRAPKLAAFLENFPLTIQSAVLTEKLAELDEASGKPESAIDTWERALALKPTPQQKIRIRRTLAEKLLAAGRKEDAIKNWQQLLAEEPDYPGRSLVLRELQELQLTNNVPSTN